MCSNMRAATEDGCNTYYLESGLCKAGVLDDPMTFTKPDGSSSTLVAVKVLISTKPESHGTKQKPGKGTKFKSNMTKISI